MRSSSATRQGSSDVLETTIRPREPQGAVQGHRRRCHGARAEGHAHQLRHHRSHRNRSGRRVPRHAIYTGQSADVGQRILAHLRHAAVIPHDPGPLYERLAALIHSGTMPTFRILQVHRTRAQAIVAETTWAQRLLRSRARLLNIPPDQSRILTPSSVRRMQRVGLFGLSLADAREAGLGLRVSCRGGCTPLTLQTRVLARRYREYLTLLSVRRRMSHCHVCGCQNGFRLLAGQSNRRNLSLWPLVS